MTAISNPISYTDTQDEHAHAHPELTFLKRYLFATDHKIIGLQFMFLGLAFMVIGGLLAMLIRWQLAWPTPQLQMQHPVPVLSTLLWGQVDPVTHAITPGVMPPDFYSMAFTMHGTIMIFFVIIVLLVGSFGNYLIPLMIGAEDMAFPFLNGFAFWSAVPAGVIMLTGFFLTGGAAQSGWTSYPPLSGLPMNAHEQIYSVASGWDHFVMLLRVHGPLMTDTAGRLIKDTAGNPQVKGSTWAAPAIFMNLTAWFMLASYLCTYHIKLGHRFLNAAASIVAALIFAITMTRSTQYFIYDGQACWFMSLFLLGFSSIMGAVNYLTTIVKLRCPGMTMFRLPLTVWGLFITSLLVLLATPVLAGTLLMNLLDHQMVSFGNEMFRLTSFFEPIDHTIPTNTIDMNSGGGFALLHQHLFWFYSHPAVYIMILPAMGMVSDILACFSRKPVFGYRPMVYALAAIAFLGFIVWAHHMFQSGMNPTLGTTFAVSTMFIAVPSAIKVFNWMGTMWGGNIRFTVPMCNAIAFVSMFVIGGLSGIFMASTAVDLHIHMTYFIVAHIHYVLFGGSMFGIFAAIYYWYPKMFGRMMNSTLGYIHFWLSIVFFNCTFFAMHILGMGGFPRRVADYMNYPSFQHFLPMNQFISMSAFCLGIAQIFFAINFIGSWLWGKKAPANPWQATTLEWTRRSQSAAAWKFPHDPGRASWPL